MIAETSRLREWALDDLQDFEEIHAGEEIAAKERDGVHYSLGRLSTNGAATMG